MYRIRPGIVLTHVCGQSILVSAYEARPFCPYTTILNDTGEVIWKCLSDGKSIPEIVIRMNEVFDIPPETDTEKLIREYIDQRHTNGYVLYEEDLES